MRSEVIEDFIGLEALVDCIIGVHYMRELSLAFYHVKAKRSSPHRRVR